MTVLYDDRSPKSGSHVLLIGVGDYPFLKDGSAPAASRFALHMSMGQLSSPPLSLQELARWFTGANQDGFNNPERPLRSLQVLCSAAAPLPLGAAGGGVKPVDRADTAGVTQAIHAWMARAGRNPENLAIFYFCGHGLQFEEAANALLLDDFGGNTANPMFNAIAFDELRTGLLGQCKARYQVHFIDACRTPPSRDFIDTFGDKSVGQAVVAGRLERKLGGKVAPVFFAAGLAAAAYGRKDEPSIFTQGLLRCLRGAGSRDADDHWEITIPAIAEGINKGVESLALIRMPQYCQPRDTGESFTLHRLRGDPEVVVKIFTRDPTQMDKTILTHINDGTGARVERPPFPEPWWLMLPAGSYTFEARAAADRALMSRRARSIEPPAREVGL